MMIKEGTIIGIIAGLIVVGLKTLYDAMNYKPNLGTSMFTFPTSSAEAFGQAPLMGILFGVPLGLVIGIVIGVVFSYLGHYNLIRWPMINMLLGTALGWFIVRGSFKVCEYLFLGIGAYKFGKIIFFILLVLTPLLSDLHLAGATIGAVIGLLLQRGWLNHLIIVSQ